MDWFNANSLQNDNNGETALKIDPRVQASDYTAQPTQYLFQASSHAACLIGYRMVMSCRCSRRSMYSHGRVGHWTAHPQPAATLLMFAARGDLIVSNHDSPSPGNMQLFKAGFLLASDSPAGPTGEDYGRPTASTYFSSPGFGDSLLNRGLPAKTWPSVSGALTTRMIRWASANHGSWDSAYGDASSRYAYAMADLNGSYTTSHNRVQRSIVHFKKPGTEEIVIQYDDIDAANSPTSITTHLHYPQNGEVGDSSNNWLDGISPFDEGSTTCPGNGGCANLNSNRSILEQESGTANSLNGSPCDPASNAHIDPLPQYNLVSKFLVPSGAPKVFVQFDGTSYTGSSNHTNRVSFCADSGSTNGCGAPGQSGFEVLYIHKVATQPDTTLTTTALNPTSSWTGVQTADKVAMFARGGATQSSLAMTTSHAGRAQYLIAGLTAGMYSVTVSNTPVVTGAPVSDGDNSLYFESTSGDVWITRTGNLVCSITGGALPSGIMGTPYSQTLQTSFCSAPVTWTQVSGSLCAGLSLSQAGTLSGIPSTSQACTFTVQATDSASNTATQTFTLSIARPGGVAAFSLGPICSGCVR